MDTPKECGVLWLEKHCIIFVIKKIRYVFLRIKILQDSKPMKSRSKDGFQVAGYNFVNLLVAWVIYALPSPPIPKFKLDPVWV